ncbi:hypothetical protein VPHK567_0277 [Vibrio phage K567]|nr:hypothetical protein MYOV011v1_p0346 [Vibrio phage 6E35.1a]
MFGFIGDAIDSAVDSVSNTVDDFVHDPVGTTVDMALSPVYNAADVLDGLTEGEIRVMAAAKLGADVAAGMAMSEIIEALSE